MLDAACGMGMGASGSATGDTKSPCALPARADSTKLRVNPAVANENGRVVTNKVVATGAPTKVILGADEELPRTDRGLEMTETVAVARVGSTL